MTSAIMDTYFESFEDALDQGRKQVFLDRNKSRLQLCFYDGPRVHTEYENVINLPKKQFSTQLLQSGFRCPVEFHVRDKSELRALVTEYETVKDLKHQQFKQQLLNLCPDFDETLRVYFSVDHMGKSVQRFYEFINAEFLSMGYQTYFDINNNLTLMDDFRRAKSMCEFNPHIILNINRMRNNQISDRVFNFVWFMDPTLSLYDDSKIIVRTRDYIFYLTDFIREALINKNVPTDKILRQPVVADYNTFYLDPANEREDKIIFVGNDYFFDNDPTYIYADNKLLYDELSILFNQGRLTRDKINTLSKDYQKNRIIRRLEHLEHFIFPALVRVEVLKWVASLTGINLEIYGKGWDKYPQLRPYHKGVLTSRHEVRRAYNQARYFLVAHPQTYYMSQLVEGSACGSIPLVYKDAYNTEFPHQDGFLLFHDRESLVSALARYPKEIPVNLFKAASYRSVIGRIVDLVNLGLVNS